MKQGLRIAAPAKPGGIVALIAALTVLWSCAPDKPVLEEHSVRQLAHWRDVDFDSPLDARIAPAPKAVTDYIVQDNIANGWSERPRPAAGDATFMDDLREAIREMPDPVHRLVGRKLVGIFLVEELGGTAYTELVDGTEPGVAPAHAFIALDVNAINRTANEWATWKESSPFIEDGVNTVRAMIQPKFRDDRVHAIQFIMLHEFGHVVSVGENFHPSWMEKPDPAENACAYSFACISWRLDGGKWVSHFDGVWPSRPKITFYKGPETKLPAETRDAVYAALLESNFVSLYAATNPFDDFAETFATFVHTELMRRPHRVEVLRGDTVIHRVEDCLGDGRCIAKRALMASLFAPYMN